jgi:hypothetical protein
VHVSARGLRWEGSVAEQTACWGRGGSTCTSAAWPEPAADRALLDREGAISWGAIGSTSALAHAVIKAASATACASQRNVQHGISLQDSPFRVRFDRPRGTVTIAVHDWKPGRDDVE